MGNTSFGALFGTIAFIAFELDCFGSSAFGLRFRFIGRSLDPGGSCGRGVSARIRGGFGGPLLLDRVLQIQRKPESAAAVTS